MKQEIYSPLISDKTKMFITGEFQPVARVVVCAANRIDGVILCGARHWDNIMRDLADAMNIKGAKAEQGFIDQWGAFLTREEAMSIVKANNQKIDYGRNGSNDVLFSEGLY